MAYKTDSGLWPTEVETRYLAHAGGSVLLRFFPWLAQGISVVLWGLIELAFALL